MADTSNLSELPSNPATNQVVMETKEIGSVPPTMVPQVNTNIAPPAINQQSAIQQLENDVMQAANNGLTSLPNRDTQSKCTFNNRCSSSTKLYSKICSF